MKIVYLLGATGSIGTQTIDILNQSDEHRLIGVSLGSDDQKNQSLLNQFTFEIVCCRTKEDQNKYRQLYPNTYFVYGDQGLIEVANYPQKGLLINALSGSSGLVPTVFAIESGKDIALANKETLVMAGEIITGLVKKHNVKLFPIDSEHSAIWQTIDHENPQDIKKIVITASGGAFRDLSRTALKSVTVEQALNHPNWKMGAKITIDSATMMNKGLEVIEAHHLFDLEYEMIETVLHKESIVHGLTYFKDGTIKASLGASDMRIPIGYALYYPKRMVYPHEPLNLTDLHFKPMDFKRYPLLKLAYQVGTKGGIYPTVMHAANEAAVKLFLKGKIRFLDIEKIVMETVENHPVIESPSLEEIIITDQKIQHKLFSAYETR